MFDYFKKIFTKKEKKVSYKLNIPDKIIEFKVYPDKEKLLNKIIKVGIEMGYIEPYDGMTSKEIKEYGDRVYQVNDEVPEYKLEPNNGMLSLFITDYENKEHFISNICNQSNLKFYLENMEKYDNKIHVYFRGGKYKQPTSNGIINGEYELFILVSIDMYLKK